MPQHTNRLAQESSPYLLQHAHNPVDWYPWSEDAFEKAKKENKPVLVSIGYAACHWCHVMERESFENEETAALMNELFVNIKVDREERPDVDHIYMDAVQAISGSGGWPLNVFLTPEGKPFYGGTYFPPQRAFNRASWPEVLTAIAKAYSEGRDKIEGDAEKLTEHLQASNAFGSAGGNPVFNKETVHVAFDNVIKQGDKEWGGFGRAPKFPQTFTINFLLRYSHLTGNEQARKQALLSLDKMAQGGLYDHAGGGFARYSTDTEWLVPHFEKMLYDNALLVDSLCEAYGLTGDEKYKEVIEQTLAFVERELTDESGGFYSALDADSEGVEGKFYVWSFEEVKNIIGEDADIFCKYYDITPGGNWEGSNILFVKMGLSQFAAKNELDEKRLKSLLASGREKLLQARSGRVRPQLDDKILLSWNALMNIAYVKAYAATGNEAYRQTAERNMQFLLSSFGAADGLLHHTWKGGQAKYPAFLDDYSYLIAALIELAQATGNFSFLEEAQKWTQNVLEGFSDTATALFFFTHVTQTDILLRKKEVYDGATPSGNSVMAQNLYRLSILLDKGDWRSRAEAMLASFGEVTVKYPTSFGVWLALLMETVWGTSEIAIVGENWQQLLSKVQKMYIPHKLVMAAEGASEKFPLLLNRDNYGKGSIYLCENYACRMPVTTIGDLKSLLESNN